MAQFQVTGNVIALYCNDALCGNSVRLILCNNTKLLEATRHMTMLRMMWKEVQVRTVAWVNWNFVSCVAKLVRTSKTSSRKPLALTVCCLMYSAQKVWLCKLDILYKHMAMVATTIIHRVGAPSHMNIRCAWLKFARKSQQDYVVCLLHHHLI